MSVSDSRGTSCFMKTSLGHMNFLLVRDYFTYFLFLLSQTSVDLISVAFKVQVCDGDW